MYRFKAGNKTITLFELSKLDVKSNTGDNQEDYLIAMSSGGPQIISDDLSPSKVLGMHGHLWYEFKKELMDKVTYPSYLAEKLGLDGPAAREFMVEFNRYIGRYKNGKA